MPTPVNTSGGNSPVQQAAVQNMRGGATAATPPAQAPMPGGPSQGGPMPGQGSPLAQILAQAFQILLQSGPTPQNLSALEGFWRSVMQLSSAGSSPQAPLGQAPGNTPPPEAAPPQGLAGMGSPMVPPRQV